MRLTLRLLSPSCDDDVLIHRSVRCSGRAAGAISGCGRAEQNRVQQRFHKHLKNLVEPKCLCLLVCIITCALVNTGSYSVCRFTYKFQCRRDGPEKWQVREVNEGKPELMSKKERERENHTFWLFASVHFSHQILAPTN